MPQQDTYSQRSSTDRSMSEISGGTAPNGLRAGGSSSGSAGSAGMVMTLLARPSGPRRWCQAQIDPERSSTLMTTPTNPQVLDGSWAGRSSSTIWCWSPRSTRWVSLRSDIAPEVEVVAELAAQQILGVEAVLEHRRGGPFGGDDGVVVQVPPAVVAEALLPAVGFPGADDVEGVMVEQGDPAGAVVAVGPAEVRTGRCPRGHSGWCGGASSRPWRPARRPRWSADHLGLAGVGLGVHDIGPR